MAESEKALRERWMDLLGEDGFRPHLTVCYRLGTYAMAPDFAVLAAANEENHEAKVAKLTVERMVDQCRYSADRFFNRLKGSARPMPLAS